MDNKQLGKHLVTGAINELTENEVLRKRLYRITGGETYDPNQAKRGYLYIRSIDRQNFPLGDPANFSVDLKSGSILRNPKYLKLESLSMARTFYNFFNATIAFSENNVDNVVFLSPVFNGFVDDLTAFCTRLSAAMNAAVEIGGAATPANTYTCALDASTGKITISRSAGAVNFNIWWNVYSTDYDSSTDAPLVSSPYFNTGYNDYAYFGGWNNPQFTATGYGTTAVGTGVANLVTQYGVGVTLGGLETRYITSSFIGLTYYVPINNVANREAILYQSANTFENILEFSYRPEFQLDLLKIQLNDSYGIQLDLNGSEWEMVLSYELWERRV